jgi:hypothetical protein
MSDQGIRILDALEVLGFDARRLSYLISLAAGDKREEVEEAAQEHLSWLDALLDLDVESSSVYPGMHRYAIYKSETTCPIGFVYAVSEAAALVAWCDHNDAVVFARLDPLQQPHVIPLEYDAERPAAPR